MSKQKNNPKDTAEQDLPDVEAQPEALPIDDAADDGPEVGSIRMPSEDDLSDDPIAALQRERDELNDRLLRAHADYQNLARRAQVNVTEARQQQLKDIAGALLTVLDTFDHALLTDAAKTNAEDILKGVHIVRDQLLQTLEQFGVKRMQVDAGDAFDPNQHEALMRQAVEGLDPDHVAAELQPGYTLEDKTLRPAKVSVTE